MSDNANKPFLGFGLGLRTEHYQQILEQRPAQIDWLEILTENYLVKGGKPLHFLDQIRSHYPMAMHGVSLSIGSTDELDLDYLKDLKLLLERVEPEWFSDHLCWTGINQLNLHDLLPLPYTEEAIVHVADRISRVQDFIGRQMLLENLSSYVTYNEDVMPEWEFLNAVSQRADCYILLDINNVFVSSVNHQFEPEDYLRAINPERVLQHHLAGHSHDGDLIIDTHDQTIIDPVWELYEKAAHHFGPVSTMIERDDNIPPLDDLIAELERARRIGLSVFGDSL